MDPHARFDNAKRPGVRKRGLTAARDTRLLGIVESGHTSQHERLQTAMRQVREEVSARPTVGLVLGSGLGDFADTFVDRRNIPYDQITGMPVSSVEGHAGNLVLGRSGSTPVVAMQGRAHLYEGHTPADVVFGVRLMRWLGAETIVITNAAGGIDPELTPGSLMAISDHLNFTGRNCLVGPHEPELGPRFVDMTTPYDSELREHARDVAARMGLELPEGVYAGLLGPSYETPAEIRMLRALGADAVGMSTVLEVIAARHLGARVLGMSCITNPAAGLGARPLSHEEVKETAERTRERFEQLLAGVLERIA